MVVAIRAQPAPGAATTAGVDDTPVVLDDGVVVGAVACRWWLPPQPAVIAHTAVTSPMSESRARPCGRCVLGDTAQDAQGAGGGRELAVDGPGLAGSAVDMNMGDAGTDHRG